MTIAGTGGYQFYNEYRSAIEAGLVLDASMPKLWCSIEAFEKANLFVLKKLQDGWAQADIRDYPAIAYKEDPRQYHLYIKDQNLLEQDTLIRFIAKKFKMESYVHCYQVWIDGAEIVFPGKIYLWINKERLSNFISITDFKLS